MTETLFERYVLVTGGAGFIGSHFLEYLVTKYPNYHFTCIDKLNYVSSYSTKFLDSLTSLPNFKFIKRDLALELEFLKQLLVFNFNTNRITEVINFAAESSVDISFDDPLYVISNNILSTANLLECFRLVKLANPEETFNFLHVSTDEVYGDEGIQSDESASLRPTNPYSASKASLDMIINSYKCSWKLPISIVRPNNVYGPRQYPNKLVPAAINRLFSGKPVRIHGSGSNLRCYLHVHDLVRALELVWKSPNKGQVFNVGNGDEILNVALVEKICKLYFKDEPFELQKHVEFVEDRKYNDMRYSMSCEKIGELGWSPRIRLEDGLSEMIEMQRG
ncbi:putative dtdp-glucose 4,6-dehydratase [Suhomyces tanzawaensis NRRL Y-17324]|uniref:Putative dtdp-glucose 4,6-dehydratase n=1 Tax=Suhomyces tanzawaensis NRRL Y-17324 TaxID=984487 RepID=A0A1E4SJ80_9ASCO|nr:putative dtdp-glucose 4,6-dehydratase [Suhomyces tanzawaensis NRRL Y-17324]ODV79492.1 putative dtdp-glucose 4,6-dehydratase [Suhomyces tanzawaensis NRRL Y-17324]